MTSSVMRHATPVSVCRQPVALIELGTPVVNCARWALSRLYGCLVIEYAEWAFEYLVDNESVRFEARDEDDAREFRAKVDGRLLVSAVFETR
jgi:hypothetical protein